MSRRALADLALPDLRDLRDLIAQAGTLAALDSLATECERRRSAGAAQAGWFARCRARAIKAVATRRAKQPAPAAPPAAAPAQGRPARAAKPLSLIAYLIRLGGVREHRGDLRSIMGTYRVRPGLVNNRRGLALDIAAGRALTAGYFPSTFARGAAGNPRVPEQELTAEIAPSRPSRRPTCWRRLAKNSGAGPAGRMVMRRWPKPTRRGKRTTPRSPKRKTLAGGARWSRSCAGLVGPTPAPLSTRPPASMTGGTCRGEHAP